MRREEGTNGTVVPPDHIAWSVPLCRKHVLLLTQSSIPHSREEKEERAHLRLRAMVNQLPNELLRLLEIPDLRSDYALGVRGDEEGLVAVRGGLDEPVLASGERELEEEEEREWTNLW